MGAVPGQVVEFNYTNWAARYPELSAWVGQPLAQLYFDEATLYCDNTPCSPIANLSQRTMFLNMLTAHVAALNASLNNQPSNPLVGRISHAVEGSVTVQTQLDVPPGCPQFFAQTKYGIAFWVASAGYRTMHYVAGI